MLLRNEAKVKTDDEMVTAHETGFATLLPAILAVFIAIVL